MSTVDDLRRLLEPHTEADVTLTYQRFQEVTQTEDPAAFVQYMVQQGMLAPELAGLMESELQAGAGVAFDHAQQPRSNPPQPSNSESTVVLEPKESSGSSRRIGYSGSSQPVGHSSSSHRIAHGEPVSVRSPNLARLRLGREIGRGGMGRIFRADQVELGRPVALKLLRTGLGEVVRERFVREARITAQLDHPNIVPVHGLEISPDGRSVGYAMKLVEGKTLRAYLADATAMYATGGPIDEAHSLPKRLEHFLKICDAVAFAHARGILHRDLKPSNFMIGKFNEVYVMDWGIARRMDAVDDLPAEAPLERGGTSPDLTEVGEVIGSLRYMSPEQADARGTIDARADQYALGLVLFEVVSLRPAISSNTTEGALELAMAGTKAPLEHVSKRERIPPELRAIIEKVTAIAPADRYASVTELAEDIRRYLRGEAVLARPDTLGQRLARWTSRHRRATLAALLGVLAIAAVTVSVTLYRGAASELAARRRGDARTAFYVDVAAQARHIDSRFQKMEEALEGLRTAAEWALAGPEPTGDAPLYFASDFADPASRPKDFTKETAYRWPVSVDFPVVGLSPGTSKEAVLPKLRRLSPLREHIRTMVLAAAEGDFRVLSPEKQREMLLQRRSPIDYAYIDLPEGVHMVYPGVDALPLGYDVRTAGFYKMSVNKRGKRWGSPYIDSTTDEQGDDLVLPCTQGLWSPTGEFVGVAGVEITVTKLVETALALPGRSTLRTTLVDRQGKKVIDSRDAGKRFKASGKDESLQLMDFDLPEVVAAVREGSVGMRDVQRDGVELVVGIVRLDVLGWYYVVEVEAETLRGDTPG